MCLAQGHNAVTPVRLEPAAPRSRVKHSTTEPLGSHMSQHDRKIVDLDIKNRLKVVQVSHWFTKGLISSLWIVESIIIRI